MKFPAKNKESIVVIGLGNPGEKYRKTRHNAGFAVLDYLANSLDLRFKKRIFRRYLSAEKEIGNKLFVLVKPLTYMNRSGSVIDDVIGKNYAEKNELIVICDNMDLKPGMVRLKRKGSSAGHNGIKSIMENLGRSDFKRMYIGVGRPKDGGNVVEHVLGAFEEEDEKKYREAVEKAAGALLSMSDKPFQLVMNEVNEKNN